jgi:hypothetical protein
LGQIVLQGLLKTRELHLPWLPQNPRGRSFLFGPRPAQLREDIARRPEGSHRPLKEDSPPCAMDLETLETIDPVYTFEGQLPRTQPFTAHPKICSHTGNIVAFGYEAEGFGSDVVSVFEIDKAGRKVWETRIKVPYVGLLHDFAVTESYILFFVVPLAFDPEQVKRGGIHWSWDKSLKTHLGYFRRHGDGLIRACYEFRCGCLAHRRTPFRLRGSARQF